MHCNRALQFDTPVPKPALQQIGVFVGMLAHQRMIVLMLCLLAP